MFINLGNIDCFDNGRMLKYLIETTNLPADTFKRINIKGVYSFIDVKETQIQDVLNSFKNEVYKGMKIRVDNSEGGRNKKSSSTIGKKEFEKKGRKKKYYGSAS